MYPPFDESKAKKILAKILNLLEQKKLFLAQVTQESEERKNSAVMLGALVCADENGNEVNLMANSGISKQLKFGKKENNEDLEDKSGKNSNEDSGIAKQLKFGKKENNEVLEDKSGKNSNKDSGIAKQLRFAESENNEDFVECSEITKQIRFEEKEKMMDCFARTLSVARNDEIEEENFDDFNFVIVPPVVSAEKVNEALSKNDAEIHRLTELRTKAKMMDCFARTLSSTRNDENRTNCDKEDSLTFADADSVAGDSEIKKNQNYIEEINEKLRGLCNESLEKVESLYDFACADGKIRNLKNICKVRLNGKFPPTGTGDCTAPKLLNYAFSHGLTPLSLAETIFRQNDKNENEAEKSESLEMDCFARTSSVARNDGSFATQKLEKIELVSPCDSRCKIILPEILGLEILYRDDEIVVVNKQSGLLSVPGRGPEKFDSVETRLRRLFPDCIKQPAVHRLDMETSGLMILALTKEAHRKMNQEFENREVKKEYTALLDGILAKKGFQNEGEMELYFRLDVENRPHQIWDRENGKKAVTQWKILDVERYRAPDGTTRNATRVLFIPRTGRTHQLRLASADIHGFGTPIIGDTLYGKCEEGERLLLHASKIEFTHPKSGKKMILESKAPF